ncbi:MAG TPA: hypothetical protein VGM03_05975 [Phycisphaerae bacterium]|jgi:hypothetical protein
MNYDRRGPQPREIGVVSVPIHLVPTLHDAIQPIQEAELTDVIRRALELQIVMRHDHACVTASLDRSALEKRRRVGIGLMVEFLRDGVLAESVTVGRSEPRCYSKAAELAGEDATLSSVRTTDMTQAGELARWTVRVRGNDRMALTDWDHDTYWAGEFMIPLAQVRIIR